MLLKIAKSYVYLFILFRFNQSFFGNILLCIFILVVIAQTVLTPKRRSRRWKFSTYLQPHILKFDKLNCHIKFKKKLFYLDNTFVCNFHLFIILQNFTWHFKFFNFYNAIIKSFLLLFPWYCEFLFFLL